MPQGTEQAAAALMALQTTDTHTQEQPRQHAWLPFDLERGSESEIEVVSLLSRNIIWVDFIDPPSAWIEFSLSRSRVQDIFKGQKQVT